MAVARDTPFSRVARISPIVPGVDLAGVLVDEAPGMPAGTAVIAHGYDLGVSRRDLRAATLRGLEPAREHARWT